MDDISKDNEDDLNFKTLESFDTRMVVVSYSSWAAIAFLVFLASCFVLWTFFGSIAIQVQGRGITLNAGGGLSLPSRVEGRVLDVFVVPGQLVNIKDPIATIYDLELEVELKDAIQRQREMAKDFLIAKKISEEEKKKRNEALERESDATKFELQERINQLPFLQKDLTSKKILHDEGLIPAGVLEQAERGIMEEKIIIQEKQAKISQLESEMEKSYRSDELKNYQRLYSDAENKVNELQAKDSHLKILSPIAGRVLEVRVSKGEEIKKGQSLVWMERPAEGEDSFMFYCYIPSVEGNKVEVGMKANMELAVVDPQKYGYLVGTVIKVSDFPVSDLHIYSIVHNNNLVEYLTAANPALTEVLIKPLKNPHSLSGFQWTSGSGPNIELHSGVIGTARIMVERKRPISYIFPQWWWLPEKLRTEQQ